jgi:hypothetical protein
MRINAKICPIMALLLVACSHAPRTPLESIDNFRELAAIEASAITFVESATMGNSPQGDLMVDLYKDAEGRKYFTEPLTNTLVEFDGRNLLQEHLDPIMDAAGLERKAKNFVYAAVTGFSAVEDSLTYEAGGKVGTFFVTWRDAARDLSLMPPFIQVALTADGTVFAFYNTVLVR